MKKTVLIIILLGLIQSSFAQVKIIHATEQKTYSGMGEVNMNYLIKFKSKTSVTVDSLTSFADSSRIEFNFQKIGKGTYDVSFSIVLAKPEKCRMCRDIDGKRFDLTKGVVVYYKINEKTSLLKVKKFKQLPDIMMP